MTADEQAYEDERLHEQFTVLLHDLETYLLPITAELDAVFRYRCWSVFKCNIFVASCHIVMLQCFDAGVLAAGRTFDPLQIFLKVHFYFLIGQLFQSYFTSGQIVQHGITMEKK